MYLMLADVRVYYTLYTCGRGTTVCRAGHLSDDRWTLHVHVSQDEIDAADRDEVTLQQSVVSKLTHSLLAIAAHDAVLAAAHRVGSASLAHDERAAVNTDELLEVLHHDADEPERRRTRRRSRLADAE